MAAGRKHKQLKVTALAGGVGGAKLARGLQIALGGQNLSVVVNTGDDFRHLGLWVSPDLDSVCYGLAAINDPMQGWGLAGETWRVSEEIEALGGPGWFKMGDRDLATHLIRSNYLQEGKTLTEATEALCKTWGIKTKVLPMSDGACPTLVRLKDGRTLAFQEYFVKEACLGEVQTIVLPKQGSVRCSKAAMQAVEEADLVVICPSNPWLSIDPILNMPGLREELDQKPVVAVSPFIGGKAVKGPAAKIAAELGFKPFASTLLTHYEGFLDGLLYDESEEEVERLPGAQGIILKRSNILMKDDQDKRRIAEEVMAIGQALVADR